MRCSPALTWVHDAFLEAGKFSEASPTAQHPQIVSVGATIPHMVQIDSCHAPAHLTAIVLRPCGPLAHKQHGLQNQPLQKPAVKSPRTNPSRAPRAAPVSILLHLLWARSSSGSAAAFRPDWPKRKHFGSRTQHGRNHAQSTKRHAPRRSARGRMHAAGTTLQVDSHALTFPTAILQGPLRRRSQPPSRHFLARFTRF